MNNNKHLLVQLFFVIFFSFSVSMVSASDDVDAVSAGDDQIVNAGDLVNLMGVITFEEDDSDEHKHRHDHKKHKKHKKFKKHKEYKKRHKHGHKRGHEKDDDDDEIVISWSQTAGTAVVIENANTLTPSFTAPANITADETLSFLLSVSDDDEVEVEASSSVNVMVLAPQVEFTSTVSGRVTAVDGSIVTGANINILAGGTSLTTASSDATGNFTVVLNASSDVVLHLSATGFADQVVPIRSPIANGNVFFDITMIARGATQSFDSAVGGTLSGSDGASVSVSAGSFVDAVGNSVTGNIDLTITPVDVSRPSSLAAFPGEFSGVLEGDVTDTPIISFGTVEFEFSSAGQPVNLAAGATANVVIPIYFDTYQDGSPITLGDTIPLWSLNEETGIWQQEGTGTVIFSNDSPTGFAMDATVSHFSWWNCDVSATTARAIVTVFGPDSGTALIKARTNASIGWRPTVVQTVTAVGVPTPPMIIPANAQVCFWADINFDNGSNGTTPEVCVNAATGSLVNVDLVAPGTGPLSIVTQPPSTAGILDVGGELSFPLNPVELRTATYETAVSYTIISGALPAGLSLSPVTATRAEVTGIPTEAGAFSVVIEGTDSDGFTDVITINFNITTEPVTIVTQPAAITGVLNITGYMGFAVDRVTVFPSSNETAVNYSILGGSLPAGMSLNPLSATTAEIVGTPTEAGVFNVVLRATDNDGFTDNVNVRYTILADTPPPIFESNINIGYGALPAIYDMNTFNTGSPATSWSLVSDVVFELPPEAFGIFLDPVTGTLTITNSCQFWGGTITATNANGSVSVSISINDNRCA